MVINVQTAVDNLIESREQNWPSPKDVAILLAWAEVDGWDECLKAWENSEELVVVDWHLFCGEFANDQSVEECEGLDPEELTDNDRVAHLQARLSHSLEQPDDGRSWSVHPLQIASTAGVTQIALILCQSGGQAGDYFNLLGVYTDIDQSLSALKLAGYRGGDYAVTRKEVAASWSKSPSRGNPYVQ